METHGLYLIVTAGSLVFVLLVLNIATSIGLFIGSLLTKKKPSRRAVGIALLIPVVLVILYGIYLVYVWTSYFN